MARKIKYQGGVKQTKAIQEEAKKSPLLHTYITSFEDYWLTGFSPEVGKDVTTLWPNPPDGHRHAHLRPVIYPTPEQIKANPRLGYSDSEKCWNEWQTKPISKKALKYPTSDVCLYYLVDTARTAYLFHFGDDAHNYMNSSSYKGMLSHVCNAFYNAGKELLPQNEHYELFYPKWYRSK